MPHCHKVFIKVSLSREGHYIELDGFSGVVNCEQANSFWAPEDASIKIVNETNSSFVVDSYRRIEGEGIVADAAHLDFEANGMVAKQIAEYILDKEKE